ncbi:alpha/beta hydrolase [Bermanella sp. WJH001]|uniref:alpha/beta hydrolase n=1 Tax=Bermanella sp. WJH001 TaxID=3048005 RepID=UPI0024BEDADA|nr:alpha/beta fold hydrolase [Bermanella sp. WJH001]MDJ1538309.1 alpha/beta fold hydrolase [Bermanella sp. WJH001]
MLFTINKTIGLVLCVLLLQGCTSITSLMFYPLKQYPATPAQLGYDYEPVVHQAFDGTKLYSWWMPAKGDAKGNIVFLHGNAQNISYHQFNIHWLVDAGYNVFMLGYRQYGQSEGQAMIPDIFMDVHSGLDWVLTQDNGLPVVVFGQSMGATLAVYGLASFAQKDKIDGVVLDAAFDGYATMAAEAMSRHWLTWVLQLPALAITRKYDPSQWIDQWGEKPLLMLHSPDDKTVPYEAGARLYAKALAPKSWVVTQGAHIRTFQFAQYQQRMLQFMEQLSAKEVN